MAILFTHEMGHYLAARKRRLIVTPPFFIPGPPIPPLPGTFGAFIKIRSPVTNRRALMEVGAWGPIAGSIVGIPLLVLGISLSEIKEVIAEPQGLAFGSSLILDLVCWITTGEFSSNLTIFPAPEFLSVSSASLPSHSTALFLHPTALAAWFGLFVTAMNLLPIGQLDGGHVVYALFGPRLAPKISFAFFLCLVPLGIWLWRGWLVFGLMLVFLGLRHPPPLDEVTPLSSKTSVIGLAAIILFILTFVPTPLYVTQ
jgi:membrane-associated protease RseP (regulator of RpoE activity)